MPKSVLLPGLFVLLTSGAQAEPDFTGRTITIVSSFGAGGGYTTYADILARHLGAHLPGRPNVIVRTMPGAGGLNGTQHLFNVAILACSPTSPRAAPISSRCQATGCRRSCARQSQCRRGRSSRRSGFRLAAEAP